MDDMSILRRAFEVENDPRRIRFRTTAWEPYVVGATREDVHRLIDEGMVIIATNTVTVKKYKLSEKGRMFVDAMNIGKDYPNVETPAVIKAMDMVVGFEDVKKTLAMTVAARRRVHFLLEGPPACAKSLILEGIRVSVPGAYIAFGSRTSAAGLSEVLFSIQPMVLLMDECEKMRADCFSVLLGLMESGEILETKSQKTRGIKLNTAVLAACNSSEKFPPEFLSRFALHIHFKPYTRDEFIEVCRGFLTRTEGAPEKLAALIGQVVYDNELGDVRKARGVWQLMVENTEADVWRVINFMMKYGPEKGRRQHAAAPQRAGASLL